MAVVIRRGPSTWAQLLSWDRTNDQFKKGQWFKGRIYEHHCDLSPSGRYFVYWAGNYKAPYYHWTAVSRPPYLTALSLWPNNGSIGGGLFDDESHLLLTYVSRRKAFGKPLPNGFKIEPWTGGYPSPLGHIRQARLLRDGWSQTQQGVIKTDESANSAIRQPLDPIDIWRKESGVYYLEVRTVGLWQVQGPTYVSEYRVISATTDSLVLDLGHTDWADWDRNGDLLYARSGCIFRVPSQKISSGEQVQLIDLTNTTFEPLEAPAEFKQW